MLCAGHPRLFLIHLPISFPVAAFIMLSGDAADVIGLLLVCCEIGLVFAPARQNNNDNVTAWYMPLMLEGDSHCRQ